ncbi:hypothetical protein Q8A73_014486 [Channa argus]|nr:hypothetical protein Q8A73_014486 [Channa argus]
MTVLPRHRSPQSHNQPVNHHKSFDSQLCQLCWCKHFSHYTCINSCPVGQNPIPLIASTGNSFSRFPSLTISAHSLPRQRSCGSSLRSNLPGSASRFLPQSGWSSTGHMIPGQRSSAHTEHCCTEFPGSVLFAEQQRNRVCCINEQRSAELWSQENPKR